MIPQEMRPLTEYVQGVEIRLPGMGVIGLSPEEKGVKVGLLRIAILRLCRIRMRQI